jgi:hypothetical protein
MIVGKETVIHTRRPAAWRTLPEADAALLDFLRNRGGASELAPEDTAQKVLAYFREPGRFERLSRIALFEPPRVRAMLGAIGEEIGKPEKLLARLRDSLNPLSRFDFGALATLTHADRWFAKKH